MKKISKLKMQSLIQKFHDDMVRSEEFQKIMDEFTEAQVVYGVNDTALLEKAFDFLDRECQRRLKEYMDKRGLTYETTNEIVDPIIDS